MQLRVEGVMVGGKAMVRWQAQMARFEHRNSVITIKCSYMYVRTYVYIYVYVYVYMLLQECKSTCIGKCHRGAELT